MVDENLMPNLPKQLREGYDRFRRNYFLQHRAQLERLAREGQSPHTLFITCSDSRVVPEIIVDAGPGELFTEVNIANQVHPADCDVSSAGGAVVFAVKHLKVRNVVICGHYKCGGVASVLNRSGKYDGNISAWMMSSQSIAEKTAHLPYRSETRWNAAVEENLRLQLDNLKTYRCVRERTATNKLQIQGWIYDLQGTIFILNPDSNKFEKIRDPGDYVAESNKKRIREATP